MNRVQTLMHHLNDSRSKKVIFLSHCILNENTRYFGGACRGGCVRELIEPCFARDFGVVQMPCPEQRAWGGVTKRMLLTAYGAQGTLLYRFRRILLPLFLLYTRLIYRRLARETAHQIEDYSFQEKDYWFLCCCLCAQGLTIPAHHALNGAGQTGKVA